MKSYYEKYTVTEPDADAPVPNMSVVVIQSGKFAGLHYQYGKVKFSDDSPEVSFEIFPVKIPESLGLSEDEKNDIANVEGISKTTGDILVHIIENAVADGNETPTK